MDSQSWMITGWVLLGSGVALFALTQVLLAWKKREMELRDQPPVS